MVDINLTIPIIILNVNVLNAPIKRDCQSGLKTKTQLNVDYRKPALNINTPIKRNFFKK